MCVCVSVLRAYAHQRLRTVVQGVALLSLVTVEILGDFLTGYKTGFAGHSQTSASFRVIVPRLREPVLQ